MKRAEKNIQQLLNAFKQIYPQPKCELNYNNPFQLLVATVLAAQATDKKVNEMTEALFQQYRSPEDFLALSEEELAQRIKSIHFYRTKAKNVMALCRLLVMEFGGQVPRSLEELTKLPGVGRKTANVVLSNAFNIPAIAVDTHVHRVSNRIGLVRTDNVLDTELALQQLIPKEYWSRVHNYLVLHGRYVCNAKKPKCEECAVAPWCSSKIPQTKGKL
jgi:endonuclease-3